MNNKKKKEDLNFDWKDILAMIIAVYQVLLVPFFIIILVIVLLFMVFNILA